MFASTVRFYGKVKTRKVKTAPGVHRLALSAAAEDSKGKVHARGTEFTALGGGKCNGVNYVDVLIHPKTAKSK